MSICVYDSEESKKVAEQCFSEGRVNHFLPADYREGSALFELIKNYIEKIVQEDQRN
jgi:hypothetical protein